MVEYFSATGPGWTLELMEAQYRSVLQELANGEQKSEDQIWDLVHRLHYSRPAVYEALMEYEPEDVQCRIFGHTCPVFFLQSRATETAASRPEGRNIPRQVMLKVVRRDNHVCQVCHAYVPDDEIEFDHIIPFSKGGPTTVGNLRLLCRTCNRKKSDALNELLRPQGTREP
jgi:HNH endonuclease